MDMIIRELNNQDRQWVRDILTARWASPKIVTRGILHQADQLPGFIALVDGIPKGLLTYRMVNNECEIISLDSLQEHCGIGTALILAVKTYAQNNKCDRLWLITTNDNEYAQQFYQNLGFSIVKIHINAIAESRKLKPEIPETGMNGIPVRDEIEMELIYGKREESDI